MAVAVATTTITFEHIARNLGDISDAAIGAVHPVFIGSKKIFMVQSAQDPMKEYRVYRSKSRGIQCSCPSGQHGWWNVTHPAGVCWHVRAVVALILKERRAKRDQERMNDFLQAAGVSYADCDASTLERIAERNKRPAKAVTVAPTKRAGFSLLKRA